MSPRFDWFYDGRMQKEPGRHVVELTWGDRMELQLFDFLPDFVFRFGMWEPGASAVMAGHLRSGDTAIDLGANIGCHTLLMSRLVGSSGRVVAVEAVPTTASVLRANLARNPRAANVTVVEAAVGVEASEATIFVADRSTGAAGIGKTWDEEFTGSTFVLQVRPVRELLDREVVGSARLVKLDFEGGEMGVAADLLEHGWLRDDCVLLLEVNPRPADGDPGEHDRFHAALAAKGWIVCRYQNDYDAGFYRSNDPVRFEPMGTAEEDEAPDGQVDVVVGHPDVLGALGIPGPVGRVRVDADAVRPVFGGNR